MDTPITRAEHEEFCKRIESEHKRLGDEDNRQNKRLDELEESVKGFGAIALSVEKLATSLNDMVEEQKRQRQDINELKEKPAKRWDTVIAAILGALGGGAGAAIVSLLFGGG